MIDEMTVHKGYGSYRMADFLNKNGYEPSGGGKFTSIKVNRILRDPYYCGRLEDGTTSPQLEALRVEEEQERQGIERITPAYERFKSWAEEFDTATLEQQKMIACHLFKRIEIGKGYQIRVELNMTYRQFCSEWGGNNMLMDVVG